MEWKMLLKKKKTIGILLGMFFFQIFTFLYFAQGSFDNTQEEYMSYIEEFHNKVENVVQQADSMNGISIFADANAYANRNLEKTKRDFQELLSVNPVFFENQFLTEFFNCFTLNGVVAICAIIIAFSYIEENKQNFRNIVFVTRNGRGKFIVQKIRALFLWDIIITLTFYGGTLLVSILFYHGNLVECFKYPIQSLPLFSDLPWIIGIGEFLIYYFIYRCMILFLITLLVWTVLFCVDNLLVSVGLLGILGILNYLLYSIIGSNHPFNILRYCNIWYLMSKVDFFTEYKNLDILTFAINKNIVIVAVWVVCIVLLTGISIYIGCNRYPNTSKTTYQKYKFEKFNIKLQRVRGSFLEKLSLSGMEYYKVLISQKGFIVLFLLFTILIWQSNFTKVQFSGKQELYFEFLEEYTMIPNTQSQKEIDNLVELLTAVEKEYDDAYHLYEQGKMSEEKWGLSTIKYESYTNYRQFLSLIQDQTDYLKKLQEEKGISGWYVNVYSYNYLLNEENTIWNVLLVLGIALLCSGIFPYERICGTFSIVRGSKEGRTEIFKKKMQVMIMLTFFLVFITATVEIGTTVYIYGLKGLKAPVQSIPKLSFVPFHCTIGVFLISLYLIKSIIMAAAASVTCLISTRISQKLSIIIAFFVSIPTLLDMIGFHFFKYLSLVNVLSVAPFLLQVRSVVIVILVSLIFLIIGGLSIKNIYKKWCIT